MVKNEVWIGVYVFGRCVYFRVGGYVLGEVCSGHKLSLGQVCMF